MVHVGLVTEIQIKATNNTKKFHLLIARRNLMYAPFYMVIAVLIKSWGMWISLKMISFYLPEIC
jgi:hypothetical protein